MFILPYFSIKMAHCIYGNGINSNLTTNTINANITLRMLGKMANAQQQ